MSFISMKFLLFICLTAAGYYLIPKKWQWGWLLLFSYLYYLSSGWKMTLFLIYVTMVTYGAGLALHAVEERDSIDKQTKKRRKKQVLILALVLDFGLLAILKYTNFFIENLDYLFHLELSFRNLILPIGLSFYTFQSAGYLMDVYWKRCEPERSPLRFALFVSFFPQILQGPIGRFDHLAHQLYESHSFDRVRIEHGVQRILWGYFKKLVVADTAAIFVNAAFDEYTTYTGIAIFGVLAYSAQLYGDFSGGMDIVIGIAQLFGIELDENFKRPYFAVSITDFWHRWHITLGTWMKDYIFYPLSLSKWMGKLGKSAKKIFGKTYGRALPICLANIVVFLVVGIWHGAAWKFIVYGLYNGLIIGFSGLMVQNYRSWKKRLHINDKSNGWKVFQIVRTFLLVNISWFFDRADTIPQALQMMKNAVTNFAPKQLLEIQVGTGNAGVKYTILALGILVISCLAVFVVSLLQERGIQIRNALAARPWVIRWIAYMALLMSSAMLGQPPDSTGGFIYAQF